MDIFTNPFDVLLDDFQETARPQREWIAGRGIFLIIGHFLSGVGAGGWVFSSFFGFPPGEIASVVIIALSGLAHLAFLGHPERFWRMIRVQSSWVSRGFVGMSVFLVTAGAYLALGLDYGSASVLAKVLWGLSVAAAAIVMIYKGNVYAVCRAIPIWNSPMLPVLYVAYALHSGAALLLVLSPWTEFSSGKPLMEVLELWIGLSVAVCILFYVTIMAKASVGARYSVEDLLMGRVAVGFYGGVVFFGLVIPIVIGFWNVVTPVSIGLLALVGASSLVGDFYIKYCVAKSGRYLPHVPFAA